MIMFIVTAVETVGDISGITKADLDREANRYSRRISEAPGQEREFVSIARQQEIKAGLYLMLLQKREENAITLAATANNAKIIDDAIADDAPVSPKRKMIYLIALVLGVGIPVGVIYLLELTKFKIEGRSDVEKLTSVPIVGDIPLTDEKQGAIAVFENQNNLMSETFRNIRTNLQFMLENDKKVILVTSTVSGEGKSFISANLAISLSLLGKKVVIVGLDIRKPGLNKVFNIPRKEVGITQYLANPEKNLMDLVQLSDVSKNLYILPGGTVPPNPTELLARDGLDKAIETLKKNFDYVILDTAPVGSGNFLVRRCGFGFYCRVVRGKNGVYGGISGWEQRLQRGKQGQGGGPVCASFLSHAYYREKGVLGCASKGNVRPRRAQR